MEWIFLAGAIPGPYEYAINGLAAAAYIVAVIPVLVAARGQAVMPAEVAVEEREDLDRFDEPIQRAA